MRIKKFGSSVKMEFCSIGVMATCSCADSDYSNALMGVTTSTKFSLVSVGTSVVLKLTPTNTVSLVCGNQDGFSLC